ncbi:DUF1152 domain-containing protein [bacterium]|nr:DUF1152 domain-containing protein [bacterium]
MPTHLPPEIQKELAGFWCYAQDSLTAEVLAHLMDATLPGQTVRDWTELVRYIPKDMLRPSDPGPAYWHARLAEHCRSHLVTCDYARGSLVHHLLQSDPAAAAAQLDDFGFLYMRLETLGCGQAHQIWSELLRLPEELRLAEWEDFWRGRQFLISPPDAPHPCPHLLFLALAEAYARGSSITASALNWLTEVGPRDHWLRQRFLPDRPEEHPQLFKLPEELVPHRQFEQVWIAQLQFNQRGDRLLAVTNQGRSRLWDMVSGEDLGSAELPEAVYEWTENELLAVSGFQLFRLDAQLNLLETQELCGDHPWGRRLAVGGERLATVNQLNQILICNWKDGQTSTLLPPPECGIQDLRLSQDAGRLVILGNDGEIQGWQLDEAGRPVRHYRHCRQPWSESWPESEAVWEWCSQGDWTLSWENGTWRCWNQAHGELVAQWGCPPSDEKIARDSRERYILTGKKVILGRAECVQVDSQRSRALTWKHGASTAEVLDLQDGEVLATLSGHRDALLVGCLSGDGRRAATVTKQGNLRIWDTRSGKCLRQLKGKASCVALNEDGTLALSGDNSGQVRLWSVARGHCLSILEGHDESVEWLAFGTEASLITGDAHNFLIWGPDRSIHARVARPPRIYARQVSSCGRYVYGERIGKTRWGQPLVYDLDEARVVNELPCPAAKPGDACFSPDGRQLAVANQEGEFYQSVSLRVWDLQPAASQSGSYRLPLPYNSVALSASYLAASCKGNLVRVWRRGRPTPPGHEGAVLSLDCEGDRLISGGIDKQALIWDLNSGHCLHRLQPGERWVQRVKLCGPYASLGADQQSWLYDLETGGREQQDLIPVCVSPQAEALSLDKDRLLFWNPRAGKPPVRLGPHRPQISGCAFSPDGLRAVSFNANGGLKLWDLSSLRCVKSWQTGLTDAREVRWVEDQLLVLVGPSGLWSWDLEHGSSARLAEQSSQPRQLEFGNDWQRQPLKVSRLAVWFGPIQKALVDSRGRVSAALETGELLFLELMPPGPQVRHCSEQPTLRPGAAARRRLRRSGLQQNGMERLQPCQRVLLLGSGGRSDLLAAVPLALSLKAQNKEVFLAAPLSGRKSSDRYREIPSKGKGFENRLAARLGLPLYGFQPEGTLPRLEVLRDLARELCIDALVLVEAGVETLLRGDEPSLGTAADDLVSLAAAEQIELPVKLLANLGFGYDLSKGLSHAYTLEAMAELTRDGGFYGSLSLLPGTPEFQALLEGAQLLAASHPIHRLVQALCGEFGGENYLNPLANQYWFFNLDQVAARCRVLRWLENKITAMDVHRALTNYLTVNPPRPWMEISC